MSTIRVDTSQNAAGSRTRGDCWAYCHVPVAAGVVGTLVGLNVSSITDNGVGDFTVNMTSALANANYAAFITHNGDRGVLTTSSPATKTTTAFRFAITRTTDLTAQDPTFFSFAAFGATP